jgi:hypothetical protein
VDYGGNLAKLNSISLPTDRKTGQMFCNNYASTGSEIKCLFQGIGSSELQDLSLEVDIANKMVTILENRSYKYYDGYLPMQYSMNEELIVARAIKPSMTGPLESLILIDRLNAKNKFISWGMMPKEYYNNVPPGPVQVTASAPLVSKINNKTHIFATQYTWTDDPNPTVSPFKIFRYTKNVEISINADLDTD